jgi:hypothetical protein
MEMFERLKNRRVSNFSDAFDDGSPRFEDCKFKLLFLLKVDLYLNILYSL